MCCNGANNVTLGTDQNFSKITIDSSCCSITLLFVTKHSLSVHVNKISPYFEGMQQQKYCQKFKKMLSALLRHRQSAFNEIEVWYLITKITNLFNSYNCYFISECTFCILPNRLYHQMQKTMLPNPVSHQQFVVESNYVSRLFYVIILGPMGEGLSTVKVF